jgi:hypothetical protein
VSHDVLLVIKEDLRYIRMHLKCQSDNDLSSEEKDKISKSDVASTQDIPPEVFAIT